jgi:DNA-binding XRE family transcriptional regulator
MEKQRDIELINALLNNKENECLEFKGNNSISLCFSIIFIFKSHLH